jgi:glycosyltransferase involved in cell wall biosynthesis
VVEQDQLVTLLSVVIPSRSQPQQLGFLQRSIGSIARQRGRASVDIEVVVGIDPGDQPPQLGETEVPVRFVPGRQRLQAAALNAAAAEIRGDYIAFLEDDDLWLPDHVSIALQMLEQAGFVSGTQLEVDTSGNVIRINDFPTPSGWVMPRATWEAVGPFDETYRYHLDNDWLGRLGAAAIDRIHVVEATAPIDMAAAIEVRPWLMKLAIAGGGRVRFGRHTLPVPLVNRLVHAASGVYAIKNDPSLTAKSHAEIARLEAAYGRIPW